MAIDPDPDPPTGPDMIEPTSTRLSLLSSAMTLALALTLGACDKKEDAAADADKAGDADKAATAATGAAAATAATGAAAPTAATAATGAAAPTATTGAEAPTGADDDEDDDDDDDKDDADDDKDEDEDEDDDDDDDDADEKITKKVSKPAAPKADLAAGKSLWMKKCKACHGANGDADTKIGKKEEIPSLVGNKLSLAKVTKVVKDGISGTKMKAYKDKLSDEEIANVSAFVRTL